MPGTLFVVATPIGNLEDLTFRALRTLREVDIVAAEDTRRTSKLLAHYDVRKTLVSLHEHNENREASRLIEKLASGLNVALVSDAGTPTIADPGHHLVAMARAAGLPVVPIPGASAVVAALSVSGLPAEAFLFLGFPPTGGAARDRWFQRLASEPATVVYYESPHRIGRTLAETTQYAVKRQIIVARELTKINETLVIWPQYEAIREQGEFVVVVGPVEVVEAPEPEATLVAQFIGQITEVVGLDADAAMNLAAAHFGIPVTKVRKLLKKGRILLKRSGDNLQS
jgi:16S rRNA (cytidine1402-2'-O)-methyltransferase